MSSSTSPDSIVYPVSTDSVAPLETVFANMANSIQNALISRTAQQAPGVANAAARNALYPTPADGTRVWRKDLLYEEFYYAAGSIWLPTIARPFCLLTGNWSIPSSGSFQGLGTGSFLYTEASDRMDWHSAAVNTNRITPNIPGYYKVTAGGRYGTSGVDQRILRIEKNGAEIANDRKSDLNAGVTPGLTAVTVIQMNGSTDYINFTTFQASGTTLNLQVNFTVEYMGP